MPISENKMKESMAKIKVDGRIFYTTSLIPHSSGLYPIWDKNLKFSGFIEKEKVKISTNKIKNIKNKTKWSVVKHRLGGYFVSRDGMAMSELFRLKANAVKHKRNLKKVADAIDEKYSKALSAAKNGA